MINYLLITQIFVAIFLIILILSQQRGTALGSIFGGGGFYASRRGLERKIFWLTIIFGIAFIILALLSLIL